MGRVYRADLDQTGFTPNGALAIKRKTRHFIRPFKIDDDDKYDFELVGPKHYKIVDSLTKSDDQGVAEQQINEFDPGEHGFGPFKLYTGDAHKYHHVDTFNSLDAAIEEVRFLIDADSNLITNYWKVVDGTGEQVWDQDPESMYDNMRSAGKIQFKKPGNKDVEENFADGKKPGRKGLAKRSGVNCKQSISKLRSIAAHSSGERQRMAHWCANMKSGKKK
jgi:hypothetical protein